MSRPRHEHEFLPVYDVLIDYDAEHADDAFRGVHATDQTMCACGKRGPEPPAPPTVGRAHSAGAARDPQDASGPA